MWTNDVTKNVINLLNNQHISGLSILGGEPFQNEIDMCNILTELKKHMREEQDIWIWSGYTYEQIISDQNKLKLLQLCDVLVDGRFIESQKDLTLRFRGSRNQRIINIKESLENNKIVLHELN